MLMPLNMQVCYHCLTPLTSAASTHNAAGHSFCSVPCESTARALFYDVEAALNLHPLYACCKAQSECFPLMVARAACMRLSQARHPGKQMHSHAVSANRKMLQGNIWQVLSGELLACLHMSAPHRACRYCHPFTQNILLMKLMGLVLGSNNFRSACLQCKLPASCMLHMTGVHGDEPCELCMS